MLFRFMSAAATSVLLLAGCGSTEATEAAPLGARCSKPSDCASGNCNLSGDFPGGLCTKACDRSSDCPANFACVSNSSGICMQACGAESDCASYGSSWTCREQSLEDAKEQDSGKAGVCSGR